MMPEPGIWGVGLSLVTLVHFTLEPPADSDTATEQRCPAKQSWRRQLGMWVLSMVSCGWWKGTGSFSQTVPIIDA